MLGLRGLERRGAAALGATATVSLARWCTEQSAAKVTPGKAVGALESLVATRKPVFVPQQRSFSTQTSKVADIAVDSIAAPSKPSSSFVAWYEGHLQANPVPTKMVTGSILWGLGDLVAQVVPQMAAESSADNSDFVYDYARTGRAVTFGGLIHAPTSHLHFNLLEWMTVKTGAKGLQITVFKTIMEQVSLSLGASVFFHSRIAFTHYLCFFFFNAVCLLELDFKLVS